MVLLFIDFAGMVFLAGAAFPLVAFIAERGSDKVHVVVFSACVRHLIDRYLVAQHHTPVCVGENGVDGLGIVTHRHQTTYQTSHTCT